METLNDCPLDAETYEELLRQFEPGELAAIHNYDMYTKDEDYIVYTSEIRITDKDGRPAALTLPLSIHKLFPLEVLATVPMHCMERLRTCLLEPGFQFVDGYIHMRWILNEMKRDPKNTGVCLTKVRHIIISDVPTNEDHEALKNVLRQTREVYSVVIGGCLLTEYNGTSYVTTFIDMLKQHGWLGQRLTHIGLQHVTIYSGPIDGTQHRRLPDVKVISALVCGDVQFVDLGLGEPDDSLCYWMRVHIYDSTDQYSVQPSLHVGILGKEQVDNPTFVYDCDEGVNLMCHVCVFIVTYDEGFINSIRQLLKYFVHVVNGRKLRVTLVHDTRITGRTLANVVKHFDLKSKIVGSLTCTTFDEYKDDIFE